MRLRSMLFVPGDRPDRMEKALGVGADALILDLEDAVAPDSKPAARGMVAEFLKAKTERPAPLFVRINPVDLGMVEEDMAAAADADAIMVPKAEGRATMEVIAPYLRRMNKKALLITCETPAAVFTLGDYALFKDLLIGLSWGGEDMAVGVGATANREDGIHTPPFQLIRSLTLFAAHGAGVKPVDTVYPAFTDLEGLAAYAGRARRDGFQGMLAIHPSQIPVINAAFTPSEAEIEHAKAIIAAFDANPGVGALRLDGRMIDMPHLKLAQATLAAAG
ncbi:HpcH/HpaI aldolase/citrate lyase family protein [Sphingomonas crocodyli]|uniref:CoA ester lyase n=1 Tax=Sphingomonas crocodyli TaxID=1979270 RepID=A0A437MA05_9SPHN|nr:CoA ester lyase [Sphingomonas crocodyli]RVT94470.1 CoA ester lyase [Sphingomonas crocodyli]